MTHTTISVAKDFSRTPAGCYLTDGPKSAEAFRETLLIPSLRKSNMVTVELDGALGYSAVFLQEAFGGLVRHGFRAQDLQKRLAVKSSIKTYKNRIWVYINETDREMFG